jgi:UrcA family protein
MTTTRKLISSLAAATVMACVVTTANAGDSRTATVKTSDLDLANSADVQTLYERVREAANDVCRAEAHRHYRDARFAAPLGWRERCVNDTVESTVREIANPRLAALQRPVR